MRDSADPAPDPAVGGEAPPAPAWVDVPGGPASPYGLLADRLSARVEQLMPWLHWQRDEQARENYLDLLVGLSATAEGLSALRRGDSAIGTDHLTLAVRSFESVRASELLLPGGTILD